MSGFSFREDFKRIQWGRTIWLNLLRAFAAGIVFAIIAFFAELKHLSLANSLQCLALPFGMAIGYLVFAPIFLIISKIVTAVFPGTWGEGVVGLCMIFFGLSLAFGDPLVYFLHKSKPHLVPTETFKFFNLVFVMFVLDPGNPKFG